MQRKNYRMCDENKNRIDILLKEYEIASQEFINLDNSFWTVSKFYVAIQSALLTAMGYLLIGEINKDGVMDTHLFVLFVSASVLNFFICYFWFRSLRRIREYMEVYVARSRIIEMQDDLKGLPKLYQKIGKDLYTPKKRRHRSSPCEKLLPFLFFAVWIAILLMAGYAANELFLSSLIIWGCVSPIAVIERVDIIDFVKQKWLHLILSVTIFIILFFIVKRHRLSIKDTFDTIIESFIQFLIRY